MKVPVILGPFGDLDLDRPESINQQFPTLNARTSKIKPTDNIHLDGQIDFPPPSM